MDHWERQYGNIITYRYIAACKVDGAASRIFNLGVRCTLGILQPWASGKSCCHPPSHSILSYPHYRSVRQQQRQCTHHQLKSEHILLVFIRTNPSLHMEKKHSVSRRQVNFSHASKICGLDRVFCISLPVLWWVALYSEQLHFLKYQQKDGRVKKQLLRSGTAWLLQSDSKADIVEPFLYSVALQISI
jgi:hypothetical protein